MKDVMLSGFYHGNPDTGIHYQLLRKKMMDEDLTEKYFFVISRFYGLLDGVPHVNVSVVCEDDGTVDSFRRAYDLFMHFIS